MSTQAADLAPVRPRADALTIAHARPAIRRAADATGCEDHARILFLAGSCVQGGALRQLVALAGGLQRAGWDVRVACTEMADAAQREFMRANLPVIDLRRHGRWGAPGCAWRLWRTLRAQDADVVHGQPAGGNLMALLARLAHPHTRIVWGMGATGARPPGPGRLAGAAFRLQRGLARLADLVIVDSDAALARMAERGYPRGRLRAIARGVDVRRFRYDPHGRRRVREEWGVPDAALLVGVVGRIDPTKDHPTFLKAAAELAARDARWLFACVGEGHTDHAAALRARADALGLAGRVIWTGARPDMPAVYSAFDLAASTACRGGFPTAIAEAMACGRLCVATDVGDSARVVGRCGIVVPTRDPAAVAAALEALWCAAGGAPVASAARARIVERYSLEALVAGTQAALREVVPQPART